MIERLCSFLYWSLSANSKPFGKQGKLKKLPLKVVPVSSILCLGIFWVGGCTSIRVLNTAWQTSHPLISLLIFNIYILVVFKSSSGKITYFLNCLKQSPSKSAAILCQIFLIKACLITHFSSCQSGLLKFYHFSLSSIFPRWQFKLFTFFCALKQFLTLFMLVLLRTISNSVSLFDMDVKPAHCSWSVTMIWLSISFLLLSLFAFLTNSEDQFCQKLNLLAALPLNSRGQNLIYCFACFPTSFHSSSWENLQTCWFQVYALED